MQQTVDNYQNGLKPADPSYVSVVMQENDAICVAAISVSGDSQQWTWTGDMAYTCRAQWMESEYIFEGSNRPIRCAWLDADHSSDIIAKGLSLHMRDFTGDPGLVSQYQNNTDRLCKNTARMTFWPDIAPDSEIFIFSPPLEYTGNTNENSDDPLAEDTTGSLTEPDQGKDRGNRAYPDGTDLKGWNISKKRHARDVKSRRGIKEKLAETIVVSHWPTHSAREMCEDPMALSSDFVSVQEGLFCDMTSRKLWPVCTPSITTDCFDIQNLTLNLDSSNKRGETPHKSYTKQREWGLQHAKRALLPPVDYEAETRSLVYRHKTPGSACHPPE
jgi:hypothetical protein